MINIGLGFILGLVLGSFFKCLADRSLNENAFTGRSYCPDCGHSLRWYDLIPVFSYLTSLGKCRYCHTHIPLEYPLFEIITGLLVAVLFYLQMPMWWIDFSPATILISIIVLLKSLFVGVLMAFVVTDLRAGLIPDRLTFPSIKLSFIALIGITVYQLFFPNVAADLPWWLNQYPFQNWIAAIYQPLLTHSLAAILLGGFFAGLIIITKGKGLGGGDFKLGILMGLVLGLSATVTALMISFLTGSIVGVSLILFGKKHFGQTIPFGPFLVLGSLIALFWGSEIWNWYLNLRF